MDMDSNYTVDYMTYPDDETFCDREDNNAFGAQLSIFFYLIFVLSLLGNSLVLVILYKFEKMNTVTNIILVNLVASGLLFMFSLPFLGVYHQLSTWVFGRSMCKLVCSTYNLGFYSSILFLTLMTFDRYLAVVHALEAHRFRRRGYAIAACVGVWLISILSCSKDLLVNDLRPYRGDESMLCMKLDWSTWLNLELLDQWELYIQLVVFFLFPLVVIVSCYTRIIMTVISSRVVSKFRTVRLIFVIVLFFFICWAPYNVVFLLDSFKNKSCEQTNRLGYALHLTRHLTYLYFCISPMFYTFVGRKFQNHFRLLLVTSMPWLREHIRVSQSSKSSKIRKIEGGELGTDRTNDS